VPASKTLKNTRASGNAYSQTQLRASCGTAMWLLSCFSRFAGLFPRDQQRVRSEECLGTRRGTDPAAMQCPARAKLIGADHIE
jgi:hypothetical protein